MSAGGGDRQRALGVGLPADVGEIRQRRRLDRLGRGRLRQQILPAQVSAHLEQRPGGQHACVAHQRGLGRGAAGQHERAAGVLGGEHHRERAADRSQFAGQRELARELVRVECRLRQLTVGGENAERDRQVEASRLLGQVGRRKIDRHPARGKFELRVLQRRADAVARLADLGLG